MFAIIYVTGLFHIKVGMIRIKQGQGGEILRNLDCVVNILGNHFIRLHDDDDHNKANINRLSGGNFDSNNRSFKFVPGG